MTVAFVVYVVLVIAETFGFAWAISRLSIGGKAVRIITWQKHQRWVTVGWCVVWAFYAILGIFLAPGSYVVAAGALGLGISIVARLILQIPFVSHSRDTNSPA